MSRLRSLPLDHPEVQGEIADIVAALESEREMGQSSYVDCFRSTRNKIALRTFTGIALQAWQQLTGVNFISYCTSFLFLTSPLSGYYPASPLTPKP